MPGKLTREDWQRCEDACTAYLTSGDPGVLIASRSSPISLRGYASGCAVLCLRNGDAARFQKGAAALSLLLPLQENWRDLSDLAAALRFAAKEAELDPVEQLVALPFLEETVRRLLSTRLASERFGFRVLLTSEGLDIEGADGTSLGSDLPSER